MTTTTTTEGVSARYVAAIETLRDGRPLRISQVVHLVPFKRGAVRQRLLAVEPLPVKDGRSMLFKASSIRSAFPQLATVGGGDE